MKKKIREYFIRFMIWIGYEIGLWRNLSISKDSLKKKNLMSEFLYLTEACYYTDLDRDYLRISVKNRIIASILLLCKSKSLTRKPEELKELIEKSFNIEIEETEVGYKQDNNMSFWDLNCPKEYKRLMELLSICLNNQGI